ncbi:unnamed protein product [Closterium sp. NIES-53]
MYALTDSAEGDCYLRVPPDPGIEAAALGASASAAPGTGESPAPVAGESTLSGTAPTEALHTFTLDSGASRSFFRDNTTLTLLSRLVAVSLAHPSGSAVLTHSSTVLPCPAAPSGLLSGLHLPSFSTNLVSEADLQDAWVDQFTPGGQRVTHCTCSRTGRHLATFTHRPGSGLYTLTTASPRVTASNSPLAPPPWSPLRASSSRYGLPYPCLGSSLVPPSPSSEATPTLRWTGKVGDASVFCVWGSRAFVRNTSADKLSSRDIPCVFLGFPPYAPGWQFYHPTSRRVLSSQDVTFDQSVSYYRTPPVDPLPPQGPAPSGVSQVDPAEPVEAAVDSDAACGAQPVGVGLGGAEPGGAEPGGAEPESVEPAGTASGGAAPARAESGGAIGVPSRQEPLSPQQLGEWYTRRCRGATGATAAGGVAGAAGGATDAGAAGGAAGAGAAGVGAGAGAAGAAGCTGAVGGPGCARTGGTRAAGTGGAAGVVDGDIGAEGTGAVSAVSGGVARPRPYNVRSFSSLVLRSLSVLFVLVVVFHVCVHLLSLALTLMTRCPSTDPQRVSLPSPPAYSNGLDPESDSLRAASPTVTIFLATAVTDPLFESTAASALVAKLEEFECFAATVPHLVSMLLALRGDSDAPDIPTPRSYAEAIEGPYSSKWQVPPRGANIVSGMWIFTVKRPPGSPPVLKACYVACGFNQQQGNEFFQTFSPTLKMTTLWLQLHVATQRDYKLHSLDFSTAYLQGSLHEEIWLHGPPGFTGSFPAGTQWSLPRPVYSLRQAPREWHDTVRTTLATLGFAPSTGDPSLFLRTTLLRFYVLVYVDDLVFATADTEELAHVKSELQKRHTCTDQGELTSYLGLWITWDRAQRTITLTQSHMVQQVLQCFGFTYSSPQSTPLPTGHSLSAPPSDESGYTFSLGSGSVSWRSTRSSSVLGSSCEAEIYAGAMAAQELRWLTYLLTDLGEAPRSPSVLYVENKAMLVLCHEHRLEHRTKHIALRYFLAQELQQRGQLQLAYVASQANTADVFTKALQPCDHQRFCTMLGLLPIVPHLLTS